MSDNSGLGDDHLLFGDGGLGDGGLGDHHLLSGDGGLGDDRLLFGDLLGDDAYNPNTLGGGSQRIRIPRSPLDTQQVEASLGYLRPCLQNKQIVFQDDSASQKEPQRKPLASTCPTPTQCQPLGNDHSTEQGLPFGWAQGRGARLQSQELEASLGYLRPCLSLLQTDEIGWVASGQYEVVM